MTFGIDGLSSGLDTTAIINQLMQLERQPVVRLENRQKSNDQAITGLNAIKTAMAAVGTAATALADATRAFVPRSASSTHDHVTATAAADAATGSITFSVEQLAARHAAVTDGTASGTDVVVNGSGADATVTITTADSTVHQIVVADGTTLQQLADQINATDGLAVSASLVDTGSGIKLQLTSDDSGAAGTFTSDLSALDAAAFGGTTATQVLTQGQDAELRVGTGPGAYTVTSATNTFTGLLDGLTLTASQAKPGEQVTVDVTGDTAALAAEVKAFVDAVNAALAEVDAQTRLGIDGATAGPLAGDPAMRSLRDRLLNAVTYPVAGSALGSAGLAGIQSTRDGTLTFDEAAFTAAVDADPAAVEALFRSDDAANPGLAQRVADRMEEATAATDGIIATAVAARERDNRGLDDTILAYERRLELRRTSLTRQFTNLEVVLGNLQAQQEWLTGQLSSLNALSANQ